MQTRVLETEGSVVATAPHGPIAVAGSGDTIRVSLGSLSSGKDLVQLARAGAGAGGARQRVGRISRALTQANLSLTLSLRDRTVLTLGLRARGPIASLILGFPAKVHMLNLLPALAAGVKELRG